MDWRSEVEAARQMVAIHETLGMPSAAHPHRAVVAMGAALETATHERDEARAEVERLRRELAEARGDFAEMRVDRDAYKSALDRAIELRIGDRAEARLDERWACSEFAEKWLREVSAITQDTPADLADAIRARGTGGAT